MRKIARRLHFPEAAAEDKKENKTEKTAVSHEGFLNQTLETSPFWFSEEQRNGSSDEQRKISRLRRAEEQPDGRA